MMEFVNALALLIDGKPQNNFTASRRERNDLVSRKRVSASASTAKTQRQLPTQPKEKIDPEKIIPMDEDFEDF